MNSDLSEWLVYAQALGGPAVALIAAGFGAWIAFWQLKTARNKLKFDIFDKRLKVYNAIEEVVRDLANYDALTPIIDKYIGNARESRWLFPPEIFRYLWKEIYTCLLDYDEARTKLPGGGAQALAAERQAHQRLMAKLNSLPEKFEPCSD